MDNKHTITLHWLAGWLEGEGSFICKPKGGITITGTSTDRDVLDTIKDNFGGSVYVVANRKPHWKQAWKWQLNGRLAYSLAIQLKPILHSRRQQQLDHMVAAYLKSPKYLQAKQIEERIPLILEMRSQGLLHRQIADKLGVERSVVSHVLRKQNMLAVAQR